MSPPTFLVSIEPPEIRVVEMRDGRLFDFDIERDGRMLGNIYKARVENILPGMDAAFLDIGARRNALLYVGDVAPESARGATIGQLLKYGQELLVQVARPAVGGKGARVTTRLSFPGRFCILISHSDTTGVSKRIENEEERVRLRRLADKLRPLDHGLILRTEAEGAGEPQIAADVAFLSRQLQNIRAAGENHAAPALVHQDLGLLGRLARDRLHSDVAAIHIDSLEVFDSFRLQVAALSPEIAAKIALYRDAVPIFERFGVARDLEAASQRVVPLSHGGSLILDEAEALTAIDVNSGSFVGKKGLGETVLQVNLEAVEEIARQLRLRDIGGIVVIDFIDMERTRDRVRVLNSLEAALKADRSRTRIVQISPSGLVEMTRRRESTSLRTVLNEACPTCSGTGLVPRADTIAIEARRRAREMALKNRGTGVLAVLHPETACYFLGEDAEWVSALERETGVQIWVRADEKSAPENVQLERVLPGVPLARDLMAGTLLPLPPNTPFYPREAPHYVVLNRTLVQLDEKTMPPDAALVEIVETGRHFAVGRVTGEK